MNIRPIKTNADYEAAIKKIEQLWGATQGTDSGDKLDVLATLLEAYEDQHFPIEAPDAISALLFRMEQADLTRKDLEPYIGSRARVSEILNGQRGLTLQMIRRLHRGLKIPLESLVTERKTKRKTPKPSKHHAARP